MSCSLQDYDVICTIGRGSYGTCKKIRRKTDGKILVWKELDYGGMTETEKAMLVSEVNLLREQRHKYIVRYYDRIIDRGTTMLYIIMEYCEGGDLATYINKMKKEGKNVDENFVWKILYQIVMALKECHSRNKNGKTILHRDLKPANVFLDANMDVKLGDFGLARVLSHDTSFAQTFVGTPYYMSPEQMKQMSYNEKSDVWSLGCLLYELCVLKPPFTASNKIELASKICSGRFLPMPRWYSDDLCKIITYMLQVDGSKRPTMEMLAKHPLLLKHVPAEQNPNQQKEYENMMSQRKMLQELRAKLKAMEENLNLREEQIKEKERTLHQKEKWLEAKEKKVLLKEKYAETKLAKIRDLAKKIDQAPSTGLVHAEVGSAGREHGEVMATDVTHTGIKTSSGLPSSLLTKSRDLRQVSTDLGKKPVCRPSYFYPQGGPENALISNKENEASPRKLLRRWLSRQSSSDATPSPVRLSSPLTNGLAYPSKLAGPLSKRSPLEVIGDSNHPTLQQLDRQGSSSPRGLKAPSQPDAFLRDKAMLKLLQ